MAKLGKALMSLLLDKKARQTLEAATAAAPVPRQTPQSPAHDPGKAARLPQRPAPTQEDINARLSEAQQTMVGRAATPDRRQLIQEAMKVRAQQAKVLEELPEEQRRKLQALAMMSFMRSRPGGS